MPLRIYWVVSIAVLSACGQPHQELPNQLQIGEVHSPTQGEIDQLLNSPNTFLRTATAMKLAADQNNQQDLDFLLSLFREQPINDLEEFTPLLLQKLEDDLDVAKTLMDMTGPDRMGSIPFRTSLGKQLRSGIIDGEEISGILQDAKSLFEQTMYDLAEGQQPSGREWTHNQITVAKELLLYMAMVRRNSSNLTAHPDLATGITLAYPETFAEELPADLIAEFGLTTGGQQLLFPNAGYVFGGIMQDQQNRGIDCSAYLSHATVSSVRLFTAYMEYAWLYSRGETEDLDPEVLQDYIEYGLLTTVEEYEAIEVADIAALHPGDLVVWRGTNAGHVSMATGLTLGDEFIGVEATRKDNKSIEGLHFIRQKLYVEGLSTYVLRRR